MIDCLIIGAGHNGLVAAAYLAKSGKSVLVLEAADHVGGAAISAEVFPGVPARLSKYSYLVSLLPQKILDDLGVDLELVRRSVSSYTPDPMHPESGLAIPVDDEPRLRAEFRRAVGDEQEAERWSSFYARTQRMAEAIFPTLLEPLRDASDIREDIDPNDWHDFVERPLGEVIESSLESDLARGVVLTDGLIGTFADAHDPSLRQNICFLYHVIGNGTGDWDVPRGGMGNLTGQLAERAQSFGARIETDAVVTGIMALPNEVRVEALVHGQSQTFTARYVLANCAPAVLDRLQGRRARVPQGDDTGAQVKVNMLLSRLPRLKDSSVDPRDAFRGTFHINEGYEQLASAVEQARAGRLPRPLPAEIYCHSLSDPSILDPALAAQGVQTLTLFGLHTPHALFAGPNAVSKDEVRAAVIETLNSVLAEPIEDCLYRTPAGDLCIEINTTVDVQDALGIPTGNIFHTPLDWPWALTSEEVGTWGVETDHPRVVLCGSGARRGGGVSGVPGHNAAQYVLSQPD